MAEAQKAVIYLEEVEKLAHEILNDKRTVLELSKVRDKNQEALRAIQKNPDKKAWLTVGTMLVKTPNEQCEEFLKKDMAKLTEMINKLRTDLRIKANKLQDLEHNPVMEGLNLTPLSPPEMRAIAQTWGQQTD